MRASSSTATRAPRAGRRTRPDARRGGNRALRCRRAHRRHRRGRRPPARARREAKAAADDNEDVIRHRLDVYAEQTQPLTDIYRDRGLLREVDGLGEVAEITDRILAALR